MYFLRIISSKVPTVYLIMQNDHKNRRREGVLLLLPHAPRRRYWAPRYNHYYYYYGTRPNPRKYPPLHHCVRSHTHHLQRNIEQSRARAHFIATICTFKNIRKCLRYIIVDKLLCALKIPQLVVPQSLWIALKVLQSAWRSGNGAHRLEYRYYSIKIVSIWTENN